LFPEKASRTPRFVLLLLLLAPCALSSHAQTSGQATQDVGISTAESPVAPRKIVTGVPGKDPPMGVIGIQYDGKMIRARTLFDAPDDWLKHITISIRNRSAKTLTAGGVQLAFPGIGGDPMIFYNLRFGVVPEHQATSRSGPVILPPTGGPPISIAPGEYLKISLADHYEAIRSAIEVRVPLSQAKLLVIDYGSYYFDGGFLWRFDSIAHVDPANPGVYVSAAPDGLMQKH
jgi:hypothetical protein